jgi:hypothetical protein
VHRTSEFSASYLNWLGFRLFECDTRILRVIHGRDARATEEARGIFAETFQTVSTAKEVRNTIVFKRTGSRRWVDGHAADGIDCFIVRVRYLFALNGVHLNEFHYAVIAMELKLA